MYKLYILCIVLTIFGAFGGLFFKKAANRTKSLVELLKNTNFYIGALFYVLGASLNIVVLQFLPLTIVMPLTSITYVWTIIISYFLLKENINIKKIIGISFIILGSYFLTIL